MAEYAEREARVAFHVWDLRHLALQVCTFFSIFLLLAGFWIAHDVEIPFDNCPNVSWSPPTKPIMNQRHAFYEQQKINDLKSKDLQRKSLGLARINYGGTPNAYCRADEGIVCDSAAQRAHINLNDGPYLLKSVLRSLELNAYASASMRLIVTVSIALRYAFSLVRCRDSLVFSEKSKSGLRFVCSVGPPLALFQSVATFFVVGLNIELDSPLRNVHRMAMMQFGLLTCLEMFSVLIQDSMDRRTSALKSPVFYVKLSAFLVFLVLFPQVLLNWLPFFNHKLCHPYVNWDVAAMEYACGLSVAFFVVSQLNLRLQFLLIPLKEEIRCSTIFPPSVYLSNFSYENEAWIQTNKRSAPA